MYKHNQLFDRFFNDFNIPSLVDLDKFLDTKLSFPHFDIERKENQITYAFALAGYTKDCLEAYVENGKLKLKGFVPEDSENSIEVLYNGISKRKFDLVIPLPFGNKFIEYAATFEDGILRISFDLEPKENSGVKLEIE